MNTRRINKCLKDIMIKVRTEDLDDILLDCSSKLAIESERLHAIMLSIKDPKMGLKAVDRVIVNKKTSGIKRREFLILRKQLLERLAPFLSPIENPR